MSGTPQENVEHSLFAGVIAEGSEVRASALWKSLNDHLRELRQDAPRNWLVAVTSTQTPFLVESVRLIDNRLIEIRGISFKNSTPCSLVFTPDALQVEFGYMRETDFGGPLEGAPHFF